MRARKVPFGFVNDMAAVFEQPAAAAQRFDDGRGVRSVALSGHIEGRRDLSAPPGLDADREAVLAWLLVPMRRGSSELEAGEGWPLWPAARASGSEDRPKTWKG